MKNLIRVGHCFYGIGLAAIGIQQFIYSDFRPVILPPGWPAWLHTSALAYIVGAGLVIAGLFIILGKVKSVSLLLAAFLFIVVLAFQCPFVLFVQPNSPRHLGLWTDPLKELALCGGALIMAASSLSNQSSLWMTVGRIFFGIMLIAFGTDHFYYTEFVATLVPSWIPAHNFWTYFGAVCLIGSGVSLISKIFIKQVAFLLGLMLFIWFVILHIPRAIADPHMAQGNEITSVFEALAFSGMAFVISAVFRSPEFTETSS